MLHADLLYQLALLQVPQIGTVQARALVEYFGDARSIFTARKKELGALEQIGEVRAGNIKSFQSFQKAEAEIGFIEKYKIQPLFITDSAYPQRLLHCNDAPTLLFYRGSADLNTAKVVSIIGTRTNTDYGREVTGQLISDLSQHNVLVVSGLAFGIDAIAHRAALQHGLPTVGVLAHGMHTLYPSLHRSLAKDMLQNGGLLTEFTHEVGADKHNFPKRNRIVAGLCDATVVVETALKGGSIITASLANSYNREVFAFPGKTTDAKSSGCNELIQQNKAILLKNAQQLIETMGWETPQRVIRRNTATPLFIDYSADEKILLQVLTLYDELHIDELHSVSNLAPGVVAASLLNLELYGMIQSMPGKRYRLIAGV
ncbi:DNA-processing protein DprA [Deminuibacter soli]|uniref:DNA-protecting protein DprA n=1 Tax=Deminuibacter soli TaxID=2291815 RepID=A0A3E1NDR1_9BACT|nr:DNA-processing protein DprA [Deminuibacter soli]RFM25981.1 DNA-protecting protein DprA [Deminuibacter soli]